eukprot:36196_1
MGGGNGCKSRNKQERNARKQKNTGISTKSKEHKKLAQANICQVCRQAFPNTAKESTLKVHVESKHSSKVTKTFKECFPTFGQSNDDDNDNDNNYNKNNYNKNKK